MLQRGYILQERLKVSYRSKMGVWPERCRRLATNYKRTSHFCVLPPHGKANCHRSVLGQPGIRASKVSYNSRISDYRKNKMDLYWNSCSSDILATQRRYSLVLRKTPVLPDSAWTSTINSGSQEFSFQRWKVPFMGIFSWYSVTCRWSNLAVLRAVNMTLPVSAKVLNIDWKF